jgi:hypothetical protein
VQPPCAFQRCPLNVCEQLTGKPAATVDLHFTDEDTVPEDSAPVLEIVPEVLLAGVAPTSSHGRAVALLD